MNNFEAIIELNGPAFAEGDGDKVVDKLFEGERRRILGIRLRNGAVLPKTQGAGADNGFVPRRRGNILLRRRPRRIAKDDTRDACWPLAANVEHEARAEPAMHLLVSRFIGD